MLECQTGVVVVILTTVAFIVLQIVGVYGFPTLIGTALPIVADLLTELFHSLNLSFELEYLCLCLLVFCVNLAQLTSKDLVICRESFTI